MSWKQCEKGRLGMADAQTTLAVQQYLDELVGIEGD
jgi:hypothetical protein